MTRRCASRGQKRACIPAHVLFFVLCIALGSLSGLCQRPQGHPNIRTAPPPPPPMRSAPAPASRPPAIMQPVPQRSIERSMPTPRPGHLGDWFRNHESLSPSQKEKAFRQEPGFNHLPQDAQQRLLKRFRELNSMPSAQRQRQLSFLEQLEKLSPQQRQQLQGAMTQMHTLPDDRQRMVRRALRDLRDVPPDQRQSVLDSPRFDYLSPGERGILGSIIRVEP